MAEAAPTTIKYDGPALADHAMDVAHLAPALLALSDLVKEANRYANGDRAGVKVLVSADLEQKCFELDVHLVMTIWEQAKLLIADENVRTAKEIAEWLGIASGAYFGLFHLIKWLRGQRVTSVMVRHFSRVAMGHSVSASMKGQGASSKWALTIIPGGPPPGRTCGCRTPRGCLRAH